MHRRVMKRSQWLGLALLVCFISVAVIVNIAAEQPVVLQSVTPGTLGASGWQLSSPGLFESATVSAQSARDVALESYPGAEVREVKLVHARNDHLSPTLDRLVWVVSIVPVGGILSHGPPGAQRVQGSYFLVFVDAATRQFIVAEAGGEAKL